MPFGHDEKEAAVSMERHGVYVNSNDDSRLSKIDVVSSVTMSVKRVTEFDLSTAGLLRRPKVVTCYDIFKVTRRCVRDLSMNICKGFGTEMFGQWSINL